MTRRLTPTILGQLLKLVNNPPWGTGGLNNIVEDATPQLGGALDPNGNLIGRDKGGDIASASPLVIDTDGDYFDVTGTTGFAAMTVAANRHFFLQFDGALTMTHHATNLDLPGEANITTAAGDVGEFFSTGANTVQCVNYTKADGTATVAGGGGAWTFVSSTAITAITNLDIASLAAGNDYLFSIRGAVPATDAASMHLRFSQDNGSTFKSGASDYHTVSAGAAEDNIRVLQPMGNNTDEGGHVDILLWEPNEANMHKRVVAVGRHAGSNNLELASITQAGRYDVDTNAVDAVRFYLSSGDFQALGKIVVFRRVLS
jgi:hypothetical protein